MANETMSPLRRRMIEDMTIRNFGPKDIHLNLPPMLPAIISGPLNSLCCTQF
jgi:hypothetical protein